MSVGAIGTEETQDVRKSLWATAQANITPPENNFINSVFTGYFNGTTVGNAAQN